MKKWLVMLLIGVMVFSVGCTKDDDEEEEVLPFTAMSDYIVEAGLDLPAMLTAWVLPAATINSALDNYYVIDIRGATNYAAGHVPGAVNSLLGDILTTAEAAPEGKKIAVFCYSGQSAGHAVMALRLMGYDAVVGLWGMSGWHTTLDSWSGGCSSFAIGNANWTTNAPATPVEHDYPELTTDLTDGQLILTEQVEAMLAAGFKSIAAADVLADPAAYLINNYWAQTDWDTYGGINGAVRVNTLSFATDEIKYMDPAKTNVTYCWTGQTSSMITAYLSVLGYDAKSLSRGANGMIYDNLVSHNWDASVIVDLPLEN